MALFEIHGGSFIGVASATPVGSRGQIRAIDAGAVTFKYTPLTQVLADAIGTGDGIEVDFTVNNIPIVDESSLVVYVDSIEIADTEYTVVLSTGVITFDTAPADTLAVTADYFANISDDKVVSMLVGESFSIGGGCESITSTALQNVILS